MDVINLGCRLHISTPSGIEHLKHMSFPALFYHLKRPITDARECFYGPTIIINITSQVFRRSLRTATTEGLVYAPVPNQCSGSTTPLLFYSSRTIKTLPILYLCRCRGLKVCGSGSYRNKRCVRAQLNTRGHAFTRCGLDENQVSGGDGDKKNISTN